MVRRTAGAELCATQDFVRPNASDCVKAYDDTYRGRVDLSKEAIVGDPVQTSMLQWRVPYTVRDAAGNEADTVWRDVVVQEVDLSDVEVKVRREALKSKENEIRNAVSLALADERKKTENRRQVATMHQGCPKCPTCDCKNKNEFDASMCDGICESRRWETCPAPAGEETLSTGVQFVLWLESLVPTPLVNIIVIMSAVYCAYLVLQAVLRLYLSPPSYAPAYNAAEREKGFQSHITVYSPQHHTQNGVMNSAQSIVGHPPSSTGFPPLNANASPQGPPIASSSIYGGAMAQVFAPSSRSSGPPTAGSFQSTPSVPNGLAQQQQTPIDIYGQSPIITPNKRGEGVRQRSPYGR